MIEEPKEFTIKVTMKERWIPHFLSMLDYIQYCGSVGMSRYVTIMADGDGDFHPKFYWDIEMNELVEPAQEFDGDRTYDAG